MPGNRSRNGSRASWPSACCCRLFAPRFPNWSITPCPAGAAATGSPLCRSARRRPCERTGRPALWGLPAFQAIKFLVVVDEEVDVQQSAQVWDRVGANVDPSRDTFVRPGPAAPADHAFAVPLIGSQLGIDATRKLPGEAPTAGPAELDAGQQIRELVARRWKEYGF